MRAIIGALAAGEVTSTEGLRLAELVSRWRDAGAAATTGAVFQIQFLDAGGRVIEGPGAASLDADA